MNGTYIEGEKFLQMNYAAGIQSVLTGLSGISPHIGRYIIETFGQLFSNSTLSHQQREMITIAVLTSLGDCPNQLNWHINFGLQIGLRAEEIVELITHCIPFCGFPRALNAIGIAKQVFVERNIDVKVEDELVNIDGRHERGVDKLKEIDGKHGEEVVQSLAKIAPRLADQITEFAFGEIYSRSVLDAKHRQLITLGALTAQGGCEAQLNVHINASIRVGLTSEEVIEALLQCAPYTGFPKVLNAISVARKLFT